MSQTLPSKTIHKLAFPALIAGIAEPLLSTADLAIVGNIPYNATESIAAIGIVGAFLSMLVWVFGQTRSGISSIISQYLGANKLHEVQDLPAQAMVSILLISLLILGISYPFASEIFQFYNASDAVLSHAVTYYKIRVIGFPFTLLTIAVFGTFRGLQNTVYPMYIALLGTVTNIVLDLLLVYGIEGVLPPMHLQGAAYASVIAQGVMAVSSVIVLLKKTPISLRLVLPFNKEMKRFTQMVSHLFVRTIALNIALYFGTAYAASYGTTSIAAYTIVLNLWLLGAFMIDGYSSAGNILSGKLLGAKDYKTLLKLGNTLLRYGIGFGSLLALIGAICYRNIGPLFTKDPLVIEQFENVFWIVLCMQPICAVAFIFDGIFKGLGETKYLQNLLLLTTGLVFVPTLLLLDHFNWGLAGIWITFFVWITFRGLPLFLKFRQKFSPLAQKV